MRSAHRRRPAAALRAALALAWQPQPARGSSTAPTMKLDPHGPVLYRLQPHQL